MIGIHHFLRLAQPAHAVLLALFLSSGCRPAGNPATDRADTGAAAGPAAAGRSSEFAAWTHQLAAERQEQLETIRELSRRLADLESRDGERVAAVQSARSAQDEWARTHRDEIERHEEQVRTLLARIHDLDGEVRSLQEGRLLPEISLPSDDAPSARDLDQKIRVLARNSELAAEASEARAREASQFSIGSEGIVFQSADTNFSLRIRGQIQADSRTLIHDDSYSEGNDSFSIRRARPIIEGTVFRDFDFRIVPDFAGSSPQLFDATLGYHFRPELNLRAGKFKGPVGLETLQEDAALSFNERSMVSALIPIRNVGVELGGELADGKFQYAAGIHNGTGDGRVSPNMDFGDDKEFGGRLEIRPFRHSTSDWLQHFSFGVGGSYSQIRSNAAGLSSTSGGTLPGYTTPAAQQFFAYNPVAGPVVADGTHWRISPHFSYRRGPFGLLGEYIISHQDVYNATTFRKAGLDHTAWQIAAQWVLSGEDASFSGIKPERPFDPRHGGWGAWQLVGRFGQLDIDDETFQGFANPASSASQATSWSIGVNWWLNRNIRLLSSFTHTSFDGGGIPANPADPSTLTAPATVTRRDENAVMTRFQLAF